MKNIYKFLMIAYMALSAVAAIILAVSLFFECGPIPQLSLLIQVVGFAFVSGLYFDT